MKNGTYAVLDLPFKGEDAHLVRELDDESIMHAVFDGVSTARGKNASVLTKQKLNDWADEWRIGSIDDVVRALSEISNVLYETSKGRSATTATVALKTGNTLQIVSVGDSPLYVIRNGEVLERKELNVMDKEDPEGPDYNPAVITGWVGGRSLRCHTRKLILQPKDYIVLVTDGISDNLYPFEIAKILQNKDATKGIFSSLYEGVKRRRNPIPILYNGIAQKFTKAAYDDTPHSAVVRLKNLYKQRESMDMGREDVFGHFKRDDATAVIVYLPG